MMFLMRTVLIIVALSCIGCASQRDRAVVAMNAAAKISDGAESFISRRYQESLDDCLVLPTRPEAEGCGHAVNAKFDPVWRTYRVVRQSWLLLAATVQAIDLLGEDASETELLAQLVTLGQGIKDLQHAVAMLTEDP